MDALAPRAYGAAPPPDAPTPRGARRRTVARAALVALALASACAPGGAERATADVAHLVAAAPGTLPPTYTLADETRPVLAAPPETRVQVSVPSGLRDVFTFPVPSSVAPGEVVATGVYQRRRIYPLAPQLVQVTPDVAGERRATMVLPVLARGAGPPTGLALILTTPPTSAAVETVVAGVTVPPRAELHFAYALSEAAGLPGAAPVRLEVAARRTDGERALWFTVLDPKSGQARRWNETAIPLGALAGAPVSLVFRARAAGAGRPVLAPLWADPTVTVPAERPPARRNLVLISLDTLRADRVGVYGAYRPTTPAIDALAGGAVVFTDAWAPWPETSGSHMSLFTSRYPSEHGVTSFIHAPAPTLELLAGRLRHEGYLTRAFTEDGGVWANAGFARGFSAYTERRSADLVYRGEAAATFADAMRWIEAHADRTFFLFVHTYQVHAPYSPPREYRALFADIPGREPTGQTQNALAYDRETRFTDDQVGPFLAALGRLGLAERSIVVLTSDHGEEFGEHGGMGHGRTLYREALHVPLIVSAPGLLAPAHVAAPASLLDVVPTVLELLGLAPEPSHRGASLVAAARAGAGASDRPIFSEVDRADTIAHDRVRLVSVRQGGRTAITDLRDDSTRCYDADDPGERQPHADCAALAALIAAHRRAMVPAGVAPAQVVDPRLLEKMRALGYIE